MSYVQCGKQAYATRGEARSALQTIRRYGGRDGNGKKPCRVYLCESGSHPHFHLTSQG